ncbi:hypothetical protein PU99_08825 [Pseudomonas putida]|nr:hypothetical protein PU99_08825 [Pseudomonas putida]OMQ37549.1 hypothetical protein BKX96_13790 [Pseudomonas putida]
MILILKNRALKCALDLSSQTIPQIKSLGAGLLQWRTCAKTIQRIVPITTEQSFILRLHGGASHQSIEIGLTIAELSNADH